MKVWVITILIVLTAGTAAAVVEVQPFNSDAQQALYQRLIRELRCLVCQNQNLADSNAELAIDLRQQTADMIRAGHGEDEIIEFMVSRYGDFVLYRPPLNSSTWLLWGGPLVILLCALIIAVRFIRRRVSTSDDHNEARARARQILGKGN